MKKIIFILFILFPLLCFGEEFKINGGNVKLDVLDNWTSLTRENLDNNKFLEEYNISKDELLTSYKSQNIYLDLINEDLTLEMLLVIPNIKLEVNNVNNYSDEKVLDLAKELGKKFNTDNYGTYKNGNHKFAWIYYYDENIGVYILNYYTVVNANGYNFQLQKKSEITEDEKRDYLKIIDSINVEVKDEYKKENSKINYNNIIRDAIIGAVAGGLTALLLSLKRKKNK